MTKAWSDFAPIFVPKEFDSPDMPGSGARMNLGFVEKLYRLRLKLGFPLVIDSGFRTPAHNASVGGKAESAHLVGRAADIRANGSRTRFLIIRAALDIGFTRIGIGKTFLHLDDDPFLDQQVIWLY